MEQNNPPHPRLPNNQFDDVKLPSFSAGGKSYDLRFNPQFGQTSMKYRSEEAEIVAEPYHQSRCDFGFNFRHTLQQVACLSVILSPTHTAYLNISKSMITTYCNKQFERATSE